MAGVDKIIVRGVSRLYGSTVALRGVSAELCPGDICFIEGPNGAGKSTLLGVIGTSIPPTHGTVTYAPFGERSETVRREIGWVAHEARAYRELTVRENVELAARLYGVSAEEGYARVSERIDLKAFEGQRHGTLSRGQRQRVALARALVHEPSVLLLDEPSTGLDRGSVSALERVVCDERDRGTLVIVVSHDGGLIERLGGRSIRLERGRIVGDQRVGHGAGSVSAAPPE